ncbi:exported protein of unknown function [Candidatus Hydrogenisulfobacillus filiaventi]|uniref:Photosynthesis system II assembly factor Ycf48/Hcf136-like domain-containing protein n=1 Tax=Candidatus Hydrogenisulfobacillus filiaventi TaxID=2707344 RepID=A0A6F8ZG67_9FIRM|nr:exported protein of unknown function [Candidatus Hydrogenisulfobacillus filiaventi]
MKWSTVGTVIAVFPVGLSVRARGAAFAAGNALWLTTDNGRQWGRIRLPSSTELIEVDVAGRRHLYLLSLTGRLLKPPTAAGPGRRPASPPRFPYAKPAPS